MVQPKTSSHGAHGSHGSPRVVVVGAGLLGLAAAAELARRGCAVTVLERAVPGAEASTAAAGILGPQLEHDDDGPTLDLGLAGARATRDLVRTLAAELDLAGDADIGLIEHGAIKVAFDDVDAKALARRAQWQQQRGLRVEMLTAVEARARAPFLGDGVVSAAAFPDDHCLDPRAYGKALHRLVLQRGVVLRTGVPLARLIVERGACRGAVLEDGAHLDADAVVVCAGAWSTRVPGVSEHSGLEIDVVSPVRGQIVELAPAPGTAPLDRVVYGPGGYLVPRKNGRVVAGSTTEQVGFDKQVTVAGVHAILGRVLKVVPGFAAATLVSTWAGLRPSTRDGLPYLGETRTPGLWLSTGHYRNGVLLAAVSAQALGALLMGEAPPVDVAPFSPKRVGSGT